MHAIQITEKENQLNKNNKTKCSHIVLAFLLLFFCCAKETKQPIDYVDPFICTLGDHGQLHPGATVPWGMVKLGPDTYPSSLTGDGDWAHSGYNFADTLIRGFSHLRVESSGGTAVYDRGWLIAVLPFLGKTEITPEKYATAIDKKSEQASPGFYQVYLSDHKIRAALTVDKHVGFHKYTFPQSTEAHILIEAGSYARVRESSLQIINSEEIIGHIVGQGDFYFFIKFSKPFISFAVWEEKIFPGQQEISGKRVGAITNFQTTENEIIKLKVGISTVSTDQARLNLDTEVSDWNFDAAVMRAQRAWEKMLNTVIVEGSEEYKTIFYTALYHSFQQPSLTTDVNGLYHGFDKKVYSARGHLHYDCYAFWDDYRTKFPLYSLLAPQMTREIVYSIFDIYEQSGDFWFYGDSLHRPHTSGFRVAGADGYQPFLNCRNEHMVTVVLDAYAKQIVKTDQEKAYVGARHEIMVQMPDKYEKIGYIPARPDQTCEYAYDNWCLAQMAKLLGKLDDYQKFMTRATFYKAMWDSTLRFFRAKNAQGEWLDFPDSPDINREKYTYEGTPWQYRWSVPHDIQGLINLIGGRQKFVAELDYFFANHLYQAGNQPDIHAAFLFNYAGAPYLTQKWVRTILTEPMTQRYGAHDFFEEPIVDRIYKATPDGYLLEMDDDFGCMAAWYVLSSMGLFQVCPGQPIYELTAPIFNKVTLKLDSQFYAGKEFIIETKKLSAQNIYIQRATLYNQNYRKGKDYSAPWISHQQIVAGGRLLFEMGARPNKEWGSKMEEAPPSMSK